MVAFKFKTHLSTQSFEQILSQYAGCEAEIIINIVDSQTKSTFSSNPYENSFLGKFKGSLSSSARFSSFKEEEKKKDL